MFFPKITRDIILRYEAGSYHLPSGYGKVGMTGVVSFIIL